ncbi:RNA polymerase sigma factor [Saccharopolyspora hordei]|uniref:RNA polymerase sigma factor (Sigma-70 family) n=1 Tax=Saccharopolyspora hordei TaxID=1838 RepID=A0A853APL7_9PSEU|nr:sigma factor [Saccharopolyspora hordei]NYI82241.1 RNA polymerase sigma factor (sigma-70 family) [Saccharopolyspora hordei]
MRAEQERAFREFVSERALWLRRSAYLFRGDWHLAEDLVQTTLLELYRSWRRVDMSTVDAYARVALLRVWLDERERPWRRAEWHDADPPETGDRDADPAELGERAWDRDVVRRALAEVPPRQRAVLVLCPHRSWRRTASGCCATSSRWSRTTCRAPATSVPRARSRRFRGTGPNHPRPWTCCPARPRRRRWAPGAGAAARGGARARGRDPPARAALRGRPAGRRRALRPAGPPGRVRRRGPHHPAPGLGRPTAKPRTTGSTARS